MQARNMDRRISAMMNRAERYRELASRRTAVYRDMPGGGGQRQTSSVEEYACKLADLERDLEKRIETYADLVREIEGVIAALPEQNQRDVLTLRYLNGWSWEKIALHMYLTDRWARTLHDRALKNIVVPKGDIT